MKDQCLAQRIAHGDETQPKSTRRSFLRGLFAGAAALACAGTVAIRPADASVVVWARWVLSLFNWFVRQLARIFVAVEVGQQVVDTQQQRAWVIATCRRSNGRIERWVCYVEHWKHWIWKL